MANPINPVTVTVTSTTPVPTAVGFGIILCLGFHSHFTQPMRIFNTTTALSDMVGLGFGLYDPLYRMAEAICSQTPAPTQFAIGKLPSAYDWGAELSPISATEGTVISFNVDYQGVLYPVSRTVPGSSSLSAEATAIASLISGLTGAFPTPGQAVATAITFPVDATAAINTANNLTIDSLGPVPVEIEATSSVLTGTAGTFATAMNTDTLSLHVAGADHVATFAGGEATATAVAARIQSQLAGLVTAADVGGQVVISSVKKGSTANISVSAAGSTAYGLALGPFTNSQGGVNAGPNNVVDASAVTLTEFQTLIVGVTSGAARGFQGPGGVPGVRSATTGTASKVQFAAGAFTTAFGFDTAAHSGAATSAFMSAMATGPLVAVGALSGAGQAFWIRDLQGVTFRNTNGTNGFDTALATILQGSNDFYGVAIESQSAGDIAATAAWCQANHKLYGAMSQDSIEKSASVVFSALRLATDDYVVPFFHSRGEYLECGTMGCTFAYSLDSGIIPTWAYRQPQSITADTALQADDTTYLRSQNVNVYVQSHNVGMTWEGTVSSGQYADYVVSRDWFVARSQEAIFGFLTSQQRVPFTDIGIQKVADAWWPVLKLATVNQMFAALPTLTVPKASATTTGDRSTRTLNSLSATGQFGGSVHKVNVNFVLYF